MISVCIATYNGERYIAQQLSSILMQLDKNDELIVSDAGSTDGTLKLIKEINDARIKLFTCTDKSANSRYPIMEKMDKVRYNFCNALAKAQGDYIFTADQDDVWMPNKVKRCIELLKTNECVVHDCEVFDGVNTLMPSLMEFTKPGHSLVGALIKPPFMGCCMAFTRKVLNKALPMPNIHIEYDTYIGLCAYKIGKVAIVKEALIQYRRHGSNASYCGEKSHNSLWIKFLRRYYIFISLF